MERVDAAMQSIDVGNSLGTKLANETMGNNLPRQRQVFFLFSAFFFFFFCCLLFLLFCYTRSNEKRS